MLLLSFPAQAARYDLHLGKFFNENLTTEQSQALFESLMTELGLVTAPIFLAPAETLGLNGFDLSIEGTIAPISDTENFWVMAAEGDPASILFIPHVHVRKGLPFSTEIGTQISYIPESELFIVGAEFKWALNEGFYYIPDLAVRFSINHMVGSKDFELTAGGWDISLSKAFGVGGMLSLTPYAGYSMVFVHASSHVVLEDSAAMTGRVFSEMSWDDNSFHRFFVGVRLKTYIFQVVAEGIFCSEVTLFNFKLGFDY
jgi:hypothetical protein